jgi:hypothetical protein
MPARLKAYDRGPEASPGTHAAMSETIREHLKRRTQRAMPLYIGGLLLIVLSVAWSGSVVPRAIAVVMVLLGATAFCMGLYLSVTTQCPRCGTIVSPWISIYPEHWFNRRPRGCQGCGASFDSTWP